MKWDVFNYTNWFIRYLSRHATWHQRSYQMALKQGNQKLFFHLDSTCNLPGCIYSVRRRETTPSLASLWLDTKKRRFSGTNQKPELPRPFGTGLKPCPHGLLFAFLTFLCPHLFLAHLDFSPAPLTAPGSPKMDNNLSRQMLDSIKSTCQLSKSAVSKVKCEVSRLHLIIYSHKRHKDCFSEK